MVRKIETLLEELTEAAPDAPATARTVSNPEKEADEWVRGYVRSQTVRLPCEEVTSILLARATYAASFARLSPRQNVELSTARAAEIVEILMIDLWRGCFRKNWLKSRDSTRQPGRASQTVVPMDSRYFRQPKQGRPEVWN